MDLPLCIHLLPSQCPLQPHSLHIRQMHSILQMSHTFFMCFYQHADVFPSFQTLNNTSKPSQIQEIYTHIYDPMISTMHKRQMELWNLFTKMEFKVYSGIPRGHSASSLEG